MSVIDNKQESRREVAERIVGELNWMDFRSLAPKELANAIEAALKERDERAVRLIREHRESDVCNENCWTTITAAIRNEDTK